MILKCVCMICIICVCYFLISVLNKNLCMMCICDFMRCMCVYVFDVFVRLSHVFVRFRKILNDFVSQSTILRNEHVQYVGKIIQNEREKNS